ncbi:N-acetyl-beta-D-galactosaminidase [Aureococcus anophagefferens]|nr:N-acetyl-beta-D-galactosaminidase [Aureococcus anophagefferens]
MEGPSGQPSRATGQRALDFLVGSAVCVALFSAASTRPFLRGEASTARRLAATRTDDARCLVVTPDGVEADERVRVCDGRGRGVDADGLLELHGRRRRDCGACCGRCPPHAAGSTDLCVPTSLAFELDGEARTSAVVRGAVERYAAYIFAHGDLDATRGATLAARASSSYVLENAPVRIEDAPRFAYRGVMVDCARHFIPLTYLEAVVDGMAFSKLNVLHLHLSDQESFPVESRRFPELWASAFSDYEVYTVRELRRFVEYARVRGVAVLPEFDSIGHSRSMCRGAPEGVCMASCDMSDDDTVDNVPLRPGSKTLAFLDGLYGEFLDGGDGGAGPVFPFATSTYRLMLDHVRATVASRGKRAIAWNDAYEYFGNGLDESWVFMFWTEIDEMVGAAQAGHHVISAWDMELYLDYGSNQVEGIYNFDPCAYDYGLNETTLCDMVLGESVNFWSSDYDAANLAGHALPPRGGARGARPTGNVTTNLRLGHFRCELLARGVRAGPVNVPWDKAYGSAAPPETGSCMFQ